MRFLLFDRVTRLEPGARIEGLKTISLADEALRGHFERRPLFPATLVAEAMVQLTAWCAIARHEYRFSVVLTVLEDATLPPDLAPGTTLCLAGEVLGTNSRGSIGRAAATVDGHEVARIGRVIYAHVPVPDPDVLRARFGYVGGPR